MNTDTIKVVKVGGKTDPKMLATSVLYTLKENQIVKCVALGQAIMVLTKAICMVNMFKDENMKIDFQPEMQYITGTNDSSIHNAVVFTIRKIE